MTAPSWDSPELQVAGDSPRTAKYRLLQSWYRQHVLDAIAGVDREIDGAMRPLGSRLYPEDELRPWLNFLDDWIWDYVRARVLEVHAEGGMLDEGRLLHNMLSSMPMCFNLFGYLRAVPEPALELVQLLFDPEAVAIERIDCEWTPTGSPLGDRTRLDAVIVTRHADGTGHLIAVETKYTESFSVSEQPADRYRDIHDRSGWFRDGTVDELVGRATNQLWRNTLVAATCVLDGHVADASVVVVALADDAGAVEATDGVRAALVDPERCRFVSLEAVIGTARTIGGLSTWAERFDQRYLDLTPLSLATT